MGWTDSHDYYTGEFMLSALLQTQIHDRLIELAPAKAVAAGDVFYADAPHHLKRLPMVAADALKSLTLGVDGVTPEWGGYAFAQQPLFNSANGTAGTSIGDFASQAITIEAGSDVLILGSAMIAEVKTAYPAGAYTHTYSVYRDSTELVSEAMVGRPFTGPVCTPWFKPWLDVNPGAGTYTYTVRGLYASSATSGTPTYQGEIMLFEV